MRSCQFILLIVLFIFNVFAAEAQVTPNNVDSLGFKQGMWREFKIPFGIVTDYVGIEIPQVDDKYYYLTKDKDRKYFPIIECIGEYKNGLKTGVWKEFHGNGNLKSQIEYKKGVPIGNGKMFWGNGVLKEEFTISSEDSISVKTYNLNGNLMDEMVVPKTRVIKAIYEE
ncbi:MAG TPA: hypothetical protein VIN10_13430 [Bacteroidales bacterium]